MIRRLKIGEAALYRGLRLESLRDSPEAFASSYEDALARSEESWQIQADSTAFGPDRATFVFIDEKPCGLCAIYRDAGEEGVGELIQMWVSQEHRGSSVAEDLLNEILGWAKSQGFLRIKAEVQKENGRAIRFYQKFGFALSDDACTHSDESVMLAKFVE